ncbi:hypothetical protein BDA96_10G062000 [Sorghum bicolor]|uniref:Uncharacterized protein n=1 Tax=Sorghum bicolor TaxID=4558 RepID=A0A921PZH4_SORBI|nr:hypothetical protein BDA96_10G062000 [Sorghum bicolor]
MRTSATTGHTPVAPPRSTPSPRPKRTNARRQNDRPVHHPQGPEAATPARHLTATALSFSAGQTGAPRTASPCPSTAPRRPGRQSPRGTATCARPRQAANASTTTAGRRRRPDGLLNLCRLPPPPAGDTTRTHFRGAETC